MAVATELGAIDLVTAFGCGPEPEGDSHSGNGVLGDAQGDHFKGVNDVLGRKVNNNRLGVTVRAFYEGHVDFVEDLDIIFSVLVFRVDAKGVISGDELHFLFSKLAIFSRVSDVPGKLLSHDLNARAFAFFREFLDCFSPERNGDADQKDAFDQGDSSFDVAGGVVADAEVIRLGIAGFMEAKECVGEIRQPPDEQNDHQPVDINNQIIDLSTMFRGQHR